MNLWVLNENVEIRREIGESVIKISNIGNHLFLLTINNNLYHGVVEKNEHRQAYIDLEYVRDLKLVDIDSCKEFLFTVNKDGSLFKCRETLEVVNEIELVEEYLCARGHNATKCKQKVQSIAVGEYGKLFITDSGQLWGSGYMPQIGINSEQPKRVHFFIGRFVFSVNVGNDFAIAIVSKQAKNDDADSDEEENFPPNCPKCLSASQLTSPGSLNSMSEVCPLGVKVLGSYDIETTSTSSKNDSSVSSNEKLNDENFDTKVEKNIIFRNTEAAKEFLTRQISRMSSAGEEYLVECTEKPTRILKENMTNVASFVYEGVKTVGDKVVTLSRHVSGSSDCNSVIENNDESRIHKSNSKDEVILSVSQCTSERDLSEHELQGRINFIVKTGSNLLNCEVWTWGNILHGQLGIGDIIKRERPMIITKLSNIGVKKASVQSFHAAVLTLDGRAFIWGQNDHNQVTAENNSDQSSPKLYSSPNQNERVKDIVCGEHFTTLLTNRHNVVYFGKGTRNSFNFHNNNDENNDAENKVNCFTNLLSSKQYTLLNNGRCEDDNILEFINQEQKMLEEMLAVHLHIIKPLQKKNITSSIASLLETLCRTYSDLLYFWVANIQSLIEYSNGLISMGEIIIFKYQEEHVHVYKKYLDTIHNIISVNGFANISKLLEVPAALYKLKSDVFTKKEKNNEEAISTFLSTPAARLDHYTAIIQHLCTEKNKWADFIAYYESNKKQAELTNAFWVNGGKQVEFLKSPDRRLIKDSHKDPINLLGAGRFSSHWFILFNDLFVHFNGSTASQFQLPMIWIEPVQQDENSQQQQQHQISLKMPEDSLTLVATEAEGKIEWYRALQHAVLNCLNKREALQPPMVRSGSHTFVKAGFFKDATYTGRWSQAKMHGYGQVEWPDGKTYAGQFCNNQLNGYGEMTIPNIGCYEGQWKENQKNGLGCLKYSNSDIYQGHFKDGQPHGHGFLRKGNFMASRASFYIGDWVSGSKSGYGVMDDIVAGEKYIGSWSDNKKEGQGIIVTSDGVYYEGNFHQDVFTGHGIMILEDNTHYEGEFKGTGFLNGKGVLTLPSGHTVEGSMTGAWNEGIKINGTFARTLEQKLPKSFETLCTPVHLKWKALFKHCNQVLGIQESKTPETQKIWQNVAVYLSNASSLKRKKSDRKFPNSLNHLDIIPPYGMDKLNMDNYQIVKNYLTKAFESPYHPLGSLLNDLSEAYNTTYGGRAHPLLLKHAITELIFITRRLYEVVRTLFPGLPAYGLDIYIEADDRDYVINYQALLYPIILPKVHHPLFTLFTLNNEEQERQYKRTLVEWNKQSDYTLMAFLSVDQKFFKTEDSFPHSPIKNQVFLEAIETLQQIKSTFSPTDKLLVIIQTVEKMKPVAQDILGKSYIWNMDDLFPLFLYVVVRSRIPDLGSELDFVENFMDPSLESGEMGIMFITLKACYQQILKEKSYIV
ncbi:unnamed protein product [Brassicogethes aeneus]|uniref:Alsin n=1 Tax=Brassicogethes aeneus TaxID=1431903 RepID=A0A9P0FJG6_BRAAE|nr:unnamed protein product [Brassicogethes aeneus]